MFKKKFKNLNGYYIYNLITAIFVFIFLIVSFFIKYTIKFELTNKNKVIHSIYDIFGNWNNGPYKTKSLDQIFSSNIELFRILIITFGILLLIITVLFFLKKKNKIRLNFKSENELYIGISTLLFIALLVFRVLLYITMTNIEKELNGNNTYDFSPIPNYKKATINLSFFIGSSIVSMIILSSAILFNTKILRQFFSAKRKKINNSSNRQNNN